MDFEIPKWLTKEYIKSALEYQKPYSVTVTNIEITRPIPKGNNYSCEIYGVTITFRRSDEFKDHTMSFIIKSPIESKMAKELIDFCIADKEVMIYRELVVKMKAVFKKGHDYETDMFPQSFYSTEDNVVILEDLREKGYKMADRIKQLDYEHSNLALKTLAKFHAASVVLHEKEPDLIEKVGKELMYNENSKEKFQEFFNMTTNVYIMAMSHNPEFQKYTKWLQEEGTILYSKLFSVIKPKENDFKVLNHGDYWIANMMFKYDNDNKPIHLIPIDYQVSRYVSPAFDFIYLLYGSVQENVRVDNYDQLIEIYIKELNNRLERFGSEQRLEESDFRRNLKECEHFAVFITLHFLPMVLVEFKNAMVMDEFKDKTLDEFKDHNPMMSYFTNEKLLEILGKRLDEFTRKGLIYVS